MFEHVADGSCVETLDAQQQAAATDPAARVVVVAGAGTGKTTALTGRVAHLLERGVPPERILLLTFTRRAADDMVARAASACGDAPSARRLWGGTFHAVAYRLVAEFAGVLGLGDVTVLDPSDVTDLLDLLRDEHGLTAAPSRERRPRASTLADICTRSVNTGRPAREVIAEQFPWCEPHTDAIMALLRDFMARKRARGLLDFDDLLIAWRALLDDPMVGAVLRRRWDHVLVDEYQDVNQIQVEIVERLCGDGAVLTVVGDDAQAIYGFRGAGRGHLLTAAAGREGTSVVRLEVNYRSRRPLLDLANVVRPAPDGHRLTLVPARADAPRPQRPRLRRCHDVNAEARELTDAVLEHVEQGGRLRDQAVLMRSGSHSDVLELELTARRVPFVKYGGLKFLEAAHVKDLLALLRVVVNPRDDLAWFRLLRLHTGVGPATARQLLPALLDDEVDLNEVVAAAPQAARTELQRTLSVVAEVRPVVGDPSRLASAIGDCLAALRPLLLARYRDAAVRVGDVERLAETAAQHTDLGSFITSVVLDPPASTSDQAQSPHRDDDYLTLSTIHSAKGLEWPVVHLVHAVDGAFPSDMAVGTPDELAEEERLFYVAVTRARDELHVWTPLRMPHHRTARDDRHSYAPQSRFLTPDAIAVMDVFGDARRPTRTPVGVAASARVELPTLEALFD